MYRFDSKNVQLREGLPSQRSGHVSFTVGSELYVLGGYKVNNVHEKYTNIQTLWVYNVEFNVWSKVKTGGDIIQGISGATVCMINDTVYLFGGHYKYENSSCIFALRKLEDGERLVWEEVEAVSDHIPSPRDKHVVWEWNGRMYMFGGYGPPFDSSSQYGFQKQLGEFHPDVSEESANFFIRGWNNQLAVFDPLTCEWSQPRCRGNPPAPRAAHAAVRIGSRVYIFGGRTKVCRQNDLHAFDLETNTWSGELHTSTEAPCGRSWHTMCHAADNLIFLYGGFTERQVPLGDSWTLDVGTRQWTRLQHIPCDRPRLWHTMSVTDEGDILVFGGCANNILRRGQTSEHTNSLLHFRLSPPSLRRLCLEVAYTKRQLLEPLWPSLPQLLHNWLLSRSRLQQSLAFHYPEPWHHGPDFS